MQALILAAGQGKRLKRLTNSRAKCMVEINGISLIERMLVQLDKLGLSNIIIVIGYEGAKLKKFVQEIDIKTKIIFLDNTVYFETNNIYSLYVARQLLLKEDTILLESDLIFEDAVLRRIMEDQYPNLAVVAKLESWMNGTVLTLDDEDNVIDMISTETILYLELSKYYKTVNIYKFSKEFSNKYYVPFLEAFLMAAGKNEFYEKVLKVILQLEITCIKACSLHDELWYEIDDEQDLNVASSIFLSADKRVQNLNERYGGYWRYPNLVDFCYLVNPYFPIQKMLDEMKSSFHCLVSSYPSGLEVNCFLAAQIFNLDKEQVCVGNGASELINILKMNLRGNIGILYPTFEEYGKGKNNIVPFQLKDTFTYCAKDVIEYYDSKEIGTIIIINPDNPSGNYLCKSDIMKLVDWTNKKGIKMILDESFIEFVNVENDVGIWNSGILNKYPNLIIIKSISKSYGIPGIRLGIMATGDVELIKKVKQDLPIWNINSFGEYFLQIINKYRSTHKTALEKFYTVRSQLYKDLDEITLLRPLPSQANYIMCEILGDYSSKDLTQLLLENYDILIKDLSKKQGIVGKQYIRFAIKDSTENSLLLYALKNILG